MKKTSLIPFILAAAILTGCTSKTVPTLKPSEGNGTHLPESTDNALTDDTTSVPDDTTAVPEPAPDDTTAVPEPAPDDTTAVPEPAPDETQEPEPAPDETQEPEPDAEPEYDDINMSQVIGTVGSDILVAKADGKVCVFRDEILISYDQYGDALCLNFDGTKYIYVSMQKNGAPVYALVGNDGSPGNYVPGTTLDVIGNYVMTDLAVAVPGLQHKAVYSDYCDGFTLTKTTVDDYGKRFRIDGIDDNGNRVSFDCGITEYKDQWYGMQIEYIDGGYYEHNRIYFYTSGAPCTYLTFEGPVAESHITKWSKYTIIEGYSYIFEGSEQFRPFYSEEDRYDGFELIGDYLIVYFYYSAYYNESCGIVYNSELEPAYEGNIYNFKGLSDGRYIGEIAVLEDDGNASRYLAIFDKDMNVTKKVKSTQNIIDYGSDYILKKDDDGVFRLYTPDDALLCEFPDYKAEYDYASSHYGYVDDFGEEAYVFVTYDYSDKGGEGGYFCRCYEFYYVPSTGAVGVYDAGYTYYADGAMEKPVLYLYPEETTSVTVTFEKPEILTTVYPAYNNGWNVTASPDGTLTDSRGRSYYSLYWEERYDNSDFEFTDGFCVKGEDSAAFLEDALAKLGLTEREANEFIIYWLPKMEQNEYSLIRFELTEDRDAANGLNIYPKPDSILRMAMHIKAADSPVDIPEQKLPAFERHGFVAVEWGGSVH